MSPDRIPLTPRAGPKVTRADFEASAQLRRNSEQRLVIVRSRAEKWTGALTALFGALGAVLFLQGPDNATSLTIPFRIVVGALMAVSFGLLAFAIHRSFRAAYGGTTLEELDAREIDGLAEKVARATKTNARRAQADLRHAATAVAGALAALVVAIAITWFAPATDGSTGAVCISINGQRVAELPGSSIEVSELAPGATISPCPGG